MRRIVERLPDGRYQEFNQSEYPHMWCPDIMARSLVIVRKNIIPNTHMSVGNLIPIAIEATDQITKNADPEEILLRIMVGSTSGIGVQHNNDANKTYEIMGR